MERGGRRKEEEPMGEQQSETSDILRPLTRERVEESLTRNEWNYFIDDQGDIGSAWDVGRVYYLLLGEAPILLIAGYWEGVLDQETIPAAMDLANQWEAENAMPKAYLQGRDGKGYIRGDWVLSLKGGVTDDQLDGVIHAATVSIMKFFEACQQTLPQSDVVKSVEER